MTSLRRYLLPGCVTLVAFALTFSFKPVPVRRDLEAKDRQIEISLLALPHGKVLYAVVDFDGVYLKDKRFDFTQARHAISSILKDQKIPNLIIYGTELTRYGDLVELYGGIEPGLVRYSSFSFRTLPSGSRQPLTGFLTPQCCHSVDTENTPPKG